MPWWLLLPEVPPFPPPAMVAMETKEDGVSPDTEQEDEEEEEDDEDEDREDEGFPFFTGD